MAGADSFDGLEWCRTVVDHGSSRLFHFHQWDLLRNQTSWGDNGTLPYIQSALMHNLEFYRAFMTELRESLMNDAAETFLRRYAPTIKHRSLWAQSTEELNMTVTGIPLSVIGNAIREVCFALEERTFNRLPGPI